MKLAETVTFGGGALERAAEIRGATELALFRSNKEIKLFLSFLLKL